jgi:hypothetical protein
MLLSYIDSFISIFVKLCMIDMTVFLFFINYFDLFSMIANKFYIAFVGKIVFNNFLHSLFSADYP